MKPFFLLLCLFHFQRPRAQTIILSGVVIDANTREPLAGASITIYTAQGVHGGLSNKEGRFTMYGNIKPDSIRFSMIGYGRSLLSASVLPEPSPPSHPPFLSVALSPEPSTLGEVIVHPLGVMDIVRQAAQKIPSTIPQKDFESEAFYREIIRNKDSAPYYSVAEAIFKTPIFHSQQNMQTQIGERPQQRRCRLYQAF